MTILEFCEKYSNMDDRLKENFLSENLKIKDYIPFFEKETLAERIVKSTSFDYESVDGEVVQNTNLKINTSARFILCIRAILEAYTNLTIETDDFYKEYDVLKTSGFLLQLIGTKEINGLIPYSEIEEFYSVVNMKLEDVITNNTSVQTFISNQVTRFGTLLGVTLEPILTKVAEEINGLDESKIEKMGKSLDKLLKRFV